MSDDMSFMRCEIVTLDKGTFDISFLAAFPDADLTISLQIGKFSVSAAVCSWQLFQPCCFSLLVSLLQFLFFSH